MAFEATSKRLRNAHELLLVVPLKTGFVEQTDRLTSYASRLRAVLELLFGPTRAVVEKTLLPTASSIEVLQNIYDFHYGVIDRLQQSQLVLSAVFDSSWETYFHNLVDQVGPFLDTIFMHCQGYEGRSCKDGYEAFAGFVREHQVQAGIFYSALPDLTIDDIRLLRRVSRGDLRSEPIRSVRDELPEATEAWTKRQLSRLPAAHLASSRAADLGRLVSTIYEVRKLFPDVVEAPGGRSAQSIFDDAARQLADSYLQADSQFSALIPGAGPWLAELQESRLQALDEAARADKLAREPVVLRDELTNIQGNILEPYPRVKHALLVLLQAPSSAELGALLGVLQRRVTTIRPLRSEPPESALRVNVFLTYAGLSRCGLDDAVLARFPKELREGMDQRAGLLGDLGFRNHPEYWGRLSENDTRAPDGQTFALSEVDVVVELQAERAAREGTDHAWSDQHPLHDDLQGLLAELSGSAVRTLRVEVQRRQDGDHFGLPGRDDPRRESQPVPLVDLDGRVLGKDLPQNARGHYDNALDLGELLLGYPDKRGEIARSADPQHNPDSAELFRDGSFLVLRKLRQDSAGFEQFLGGAASGPRGERDLPAAASRLRGLLLGRDSSADPEAMGRSLAHPALPAVENGFDYQDDPHGKQCPLFSHVRKTNPRFAGVPRIMRRSMPYGSVYRSDSEDERGLMFMAYNASIAQQFEVIQRWITGGNSTGQLSSNSDLLGGGDPPEGVSYAFGDGSEPRNFAPPARPFVSLLWGMYLFVPSRAALAILAGAAERSEPGLPRVSTEAAQAGREIMRGLDSIAAPQLALQAWKQVLEEAPYATQARSIWAAIRASGGSKRTPYGFLVGDVEGAERVLGDSGRCFSVRAYWHRLGETIGEHYLGLDRVAGAQAASVRSPGDTDYETRLETVGYRELAELPNRSLQERVALDGAGAFRKARELADACLDGARGIIDLRHLAKQVVGRLAELWIGIPPDYAGDAQLEVFIQHFIYISRYAFYPHPDEWLARQARESGRALRDAYGALPLATLLAMPMGKDLHARGYRDPARIQRALIGAITGFAAPAFASILTVLNDWLGSGQLERSAVSLDYQDDQRVRSQLLGPVLETLRAEPSPPLLYRTALDQNGLTEPGSLVVVSLHSAFVDAANRRADLPRQWLFGGLHGGVSDPSRPTHGCPMQDPALAALLGVVTALAQRTPLAPESPARYALAPTRRR